MKIQLASPDPNLIKQLAEEIPATLMTAGLDSQFSVSEPVPPESGPHRGDPVTLAMIILSAVSAGGAVTVGMGKEGFLTRLAKVLEAWVTRKVEVTIEGENGHKIHLSGSAGNIERMLKEQLKH
jgi:hypothetical protein